MCCHRRGMFGAPRSWKGREDPVLEPSGEARPRLGFRHLTSRTENQHAQFAVLCSVSLGELTRHLMVLRHPGFSKCRPSPHLPSAPCPALISPVRTGCSSVTPPAGAFNTQGGAHIPLFSGLLRDFAAAKLPSVNVFVGMVNITSRGWWADAEWGPTCGREATEAPARRSARPRDESGP